MMEKRRVVFAAFRHRKAGKKSFSGFYSEKRERISEARKLAHPFFLYFWGQKYQKPPHVVLRGSVRAAALHGARKIWPMRHPVADAPQPAPSFSASNESADWWCRHGRHYFIWQRTSILFGNAPRYPLPLLLPHGGSRLGFDGEKADGGLKARAAGTVCLQTRAVARRRFQPFGRRHRNRSGGFCCFSPPKSREREKSFFLVLLAPKVQERKKVCGNCNFPEPTQTFSVKPRKTLL